MLFVGAAAEARSHEGVDPPTPATPAPPATPDCDDDKDGWKTEKQQYGAKVGDS